VNRIVVALALAAALSTGSVTAATTEPQPADLSVTTGAAQSAPLAPVARLHDALIEVMKNADALGFEGRRERLDPVLRTGFNFPVMAQVAVGQYWAEMSEADRQELLAAFAEFSVATYADRFDGYSGQRFETLGEEQAPSRSVWVKTVLVIPADAEHPQGRTVNLNYLVRNFGSDGWRIIDVYLGGTVSEMATRRSEYTSVIRREGIAGLIASLESKTRAMHKAS